MLYESAISTIDLVKYKKIFMKRTFKYLFLYPLIIALSLAVLGRIINTLGFDPYYFGIAAIIASTPIILSPITIYAYYSGTKNKYKSTKFVYQGDSLLYVYLKERNPYSGGTFHYFTIHSISNYTITETHITIYGHITRRQVDERYPANKYKEHRVEKISAPNVFTNIEGLEEALQQKKEGLVKHGT